MRQTNYLKVNNTLRNDDLLLPRLAALDCPAYELIKSRHSQARWHRVTQTTSHPSGVISEVLPRRTTMARPLKYLFGRTARTISDFYSALGC
ncbi:hypothetical protein PAXRUDRAFT_10082 [Paxillus rubicundulus Ve08.2h10]|uniref:Unplaced genomic scaffold scaffold_106, whole genome shotgun sequence n=1 Tax=Paxillus rubicundulus Ve08.2h10 TaxID=930991 RepID=A0A0D0E1E1_9AGAM|nr:hypothetical protein PAXRUDRAFT_10082 [Paxillus rubicundulus Ve08.2h10]